MAEERRPADRAGRPAAQGLGRDGRLRGGQGGLVSEAGDGYVDGDVNSLDEALAPTAVGVLEYVARTLADEPDAVEVEAERKGRTVVLSLRVGPDDMGRVIGRRGRTAQALRSLVAAAGARDGVTTSVDIVD
ncbi:MAG: hypothetical protein B7Z69_09270 [Actinobacteria bacterium 21-73-9]|nr:MAG: hypothetical protein B7Z69_09270 [Actinobacteria bacterium 21-73-9]